MPCQGLLFFWIASSSEKSASWLLRVRRVATGKELAANVGQPVCIEGDLSTRNPLLVESQTRRGAEEAVLHAVKEEAKYKRRAVKTDGKIEWESKTYTVKDEVHAAPTDLLMLPSTPGADRASVPLLNPERASELPWKTVEDRLFPVPRGATFSFLERDDRVEGMHVTVRVVPVNTRVYVIGEARPHGCPLGVCMDRGQGGHYYISSKGPEALAMSAARCGTIMRVFCYLFLAAGAGVGLVELTRTSA